MSAGSAKDDDVTDPQGDAALSKTNPSDPLVGQQLGEYRIVERLGHGGMGVLYRAEQALIGKSVAVKVILGTWADDPVTAQRMVEEARAASAIRHPGIIDIFAFGQLPDGRPYLVMELLEGQPLSLALRENGRFSAAETVRVLEQAMSALEAAHAAGVVHRDLKPDNMFVNTSSEGWRVKLIDFGLAKRQGKDSNLTRPGAVMGTPAFMAPEQVRAYPVSDRTDVYAMGVVGWMLLMGHPPFHRGTPVDVMENHVRDPVPPLACGPLPEGLEALLGEMLRKEPEQRPDAATVRRRLAALKLAAGAPADSTPTIAIAGGLVALLAVLGVATWALVVREPVSEPPPLSAVRRPGPPQPVPVPAPAPAPVPTPAPPPVAEPEPRLPDDNPAERSWSCEHITDVTPVMTDFFEPQYRFFLVRFEHERTLVVKTTDKLPKRPVAILKKREQLAAARRTAGVISTRAVNSAHSGFNSDLLTHYGGDVVDLADLVFTPAPRARSR